jgi:hypothetical protein
LTWKKDKTKEVAIAQLSIERKLIHKNQRKEKKEYHCDSEEQNEH